ncbi:Phosphoribosylformylglycinamidine synthase subunit PurQ [Dirofilaria immitis]
MECKFRVTVHSNQYCLQDISFGYYYSLLKSYQQYQPFNSMNTDQDIKACDEVMLHIPVFFMWTEITHSNAFYVYLAVLLISPSLIWSVVKIFIICLEYREKLITRNQKNIQKAGSDQTSE